MKKELYKETGYPGIKQRISDNMYIVTIDLGRQLRMNKKTGLMEMKQAKTTKHVTTLKEAKEEFDYEQSDVSRKTYKKPGTEICPE